MTFQEGRRYINLLCNELSQLSYPSERLIVFSSVTLQRDRSVRVSADIRRTLDQRMSMWEENRFDLLVQEASCRDKHFTTQSRQRKRDPNHNTKVFTRLMLQGKIRSAMRFLTERSKGHVLHPHDNVKIKVIGQDKSVKVIDALQQKHPSPKLLTRSLY